MQKAIGQIPFSVLGLLFFCTTVCIGCGDDTTNETEPLVYDETANLTVRVLQSEEEALPYLDDPLTSIPFYTKSGELVANIEVSPIVVPISFGEPTADPQTDYMMVSITVEKAYLDRIYQAELRITSGVNSDEPVEWCTTLTQDVLKSERFYASLQPACFPEDRLTGSCVVTGSCDGFLGGCREDLLSFSLWGESIGRCHSWETDSE